MFFSTVKPGFLTWKSLEPALSGPARKLQFLALCTGFIFVFQDWELVLVIHTERLITWCWSFLNSHILSHVKVPFQTHIIVNLRITIPKRTNCAFIHADLIPCQCTGCTSNTVTGISAGVCLATSGAKKTCVPCPSCTLKDVMNMCSWSQKKSMLCLCRLSTNACNTAKCRHMYDKSTQLLTFLITTCPSLSHKGGKSVRATHFGTAVSIKTELWEFRLCSECRMVHIATLYECNHVFDPMWHPWLETVTVTIRSLVLNIWTKKPCFSKNVTHLLN